MRKSIIYVISMLSACSSYPSYQVKVQQGNFTYIKADLQKDLCKFEPVDFQQKNGGVFIDDKNFTKLTINIKNFQICYNNLYRVSKSNLDYYESLLEIQEGTGITES